MTTASREDDGFTLIDTLIAVVVMGTTVVALVTALSGLITATQFHRGYAVAEQVAQNTVQAAIAKVNTGTTLTADVGTSPFFSSLQVQDPSAIPPSGFVNVDDEVMFLIRGDRQGGQLYVLRGLSISPHAAGASVTPVFFCPSADELMPSDVESPPGVSVDITRVEYWDSRTSSFVERNRCLANRFGRCLRASESFLEIFNPACDSGLQRITVTVTTTGDGRRAVSTTTQALIRRGSP